MGIAAEHLKQLFEPFYQVEQKTNRALKGTGLGLAISKKFAELLGGTLTVESVEGQGSTFTLTVPLVLDRRKGVDRRHCGAGVSPARAADHRFAAVPAAAPQNAKVLLGQPLTPQAPAPEGAHA